MMLNDRFSEPMLSVGRNDMMVHYTNLPKRAVLPLGKSIQGSIYRNWKNYRH